MKMEDVLFTSFFFFIIVFPLSYSVAVVVVVVVVVQKSLKLEEFEDIFFFSLPLLVLEHTRSSKISMKGTQKTTHCQIPNLKMIIIIQSVNVIRIGNK